MAWEGPIDQIDEHRFQIPTSYQSRAMKERGVHMRVPGLIFSDANMLKAVIRDNSPDQVAHVATLPGIVGNSIAMPDIHHGYGFAIGGVAAFDAVEGVISPGGVGYDINCGVRLLRTDLSADNVRPRIEKLIHNLFSSIPTGVGSHGRMKLSIEQVEAVLENGSRWAVEQGYGWPEDIEVTEEQGCFAGANPSKVSHNAKRRGAPQLGTLGAGNHFIEVQEVAEIFDKTAAAAYGINHRGQVLVMVHTGSRGCGHQICTDSLEMMRRAASKFDLPIVDKELTSAPAQSDEAQDYFSAMKCGANFAWANRQLIVHWVRESFAQFFGDSAENLGMHQIYDVAHNIAKLEEHLVEGQMRRVYVHRKGATRSFGPGHADVPEKYREIGQPVLIPGDMGSSSYLLAGTAQSMRESFGSSCHGAGRALSRHAALKKIEKRRVLQDLHENGIYLRAKNKRLICEEAPGAYKNIDDVVSVADGSGIARQIVRLRPLGVIKG